MAMDNRLIIRLIRQKLNDRTTYILAAIVGTLISGYGQLLVPWIRSGADPFRAFADEFLRTPLLTLLTVFLAYAFPFCVGIYSAVAARYKIRRIESIADFPERNPDPVFRAARDGRLVETGAKTRLLFDKHRIDYAQKILGEEVWAQIVSRQHTGTKAAVYFEAEDVEYLVSYAPTSNDEINIYLASLPTRRDGQ